MTALQLTPPNSRRSTMFKTCCGDCGECWYVGNPRTCTCPDETTKRTWVGLTDEEMMDAIYVDDTPMERGRRVEAKLRSKNT